jgi:hypothetical protein
VGPLGPVRQRRIHIMTVGGRSDRNEGATLERGQSVVSASMRIPVFGSFIARARRSARENTPTSSCPKSAAEMQLRMHPDHCDSCTACLAMWQAGVLHKQPSSTRR